MSLDRQQPPVALTDPQSPDARSVRPDIVEPDSVTPPQLLDRGYVSSTACKSCHPDQFDSWHHSYHRTMTQVASPETVTAPFEGEVRYRGQTARLERRGDEFWIDMVDPLWEIQHFDQGHDVSYTANPPRVKERVVMTTGSHHFQVYWIRSKFGRELWQFPWRYHFVEKRWVHRLSVFLEPPEMRPGEGFRVWNRGCIGCHSVAGKPGMNLATGDMMNTSVVELGIACEACHGPGGRHVELYSSARLEEDNTADTAIDTGIDTGIVNPAKISAERSAQICGTCHSQFVVHDSDKFLTQGLDFRPGEDITRAGYFMQPPDEGNSVARRFWADGVSRSGGREFMGITESKCYQGGELSCLNCHSMHKYEDRSDQLAPRMESDEACFQCHENFRVDVSAHTHHAADSSGSRCYNCHMPHTSYALLKGIRDHSISVPVVVGLAPDSRPNACNLCHLDRTLEWTADNLLDWWGTPEEKSTATAASKLSRDEREIAASLLFLLRGDAGQRAIAAYSMGWDAAQAASGVEWMVPPLAQALQDPYAAVRYNAFGALRKISGFADFEYDFEAPGDPDELERSVLDRWRWRLSKEFVAPSHVLLDASLKPDTETIDRLSDERDNRPIRIIE
jgi:hypothetical protein